MRGCFHCLKFQLFYYYCESYSHTHGKVFITFHRIKWENLTAAENTILKIMGILIEFIVNIIKVIAINVNPVVTKVTLNSSIIV